jgi:hypothetical protein
MNGIDKTTAGIAVLGIIVLLVMIVAVVPLCLLWGVNFILVAMGLATIPITIKTWFGAFLIGLALRGGGGSSKKS